MSDINSMTQEVICGYMLGKVTSSIVTLLFLICCLIYIGKSVYAVIKNMLSEDINTLEMEERINKIERERAKEKEKLESAHQE